MTSSYLHCSGWGSWVVDRCVGFAVLDHGSRITVLVSPCLPCWIVGRGSRIRGLCSVVLGYGWLLRMAWYGAGLRVLGSAMERQRREMRDRGERELDKILLFIYNTCYSAILCLELHCSSIAKKFAILLFSILQCRWFWDLKFQISLRFDISISNANALSYIFFSNLTVNALRKCSKVSLFCLTYNTLIV